jgi:predicted negative regulator of RcsB-dependent stress response
MTRTGAAARPPVDIEERAYSLLGWAQTNMRFMIIGLVIIVGLMVGIWVYVATQANKEQRAAAEVASASGAVAAGNYALAETDLTRIVQQFAATDAGKQAVLLLSEALYGQGKYEQGIEQLQRYVGSAPDHMKAAFHSQIAAGYEEIGNFPEAAATYLRAAEVARFGADKSVYRADAARAYTLAGNTAAAKQLWEAEAADLSSPVSGEARVRLGELDAQPARPAVAR